LHRRYGTNGLSRHARLGSGRRYGSWSCPCRASWERLNPAEEGFVDLDDATPTAPRRGHLVAIRTRRGPAGHVGIVERVNPDGSVTIVSGNWSRRVARSIIPRRSVTACIAVR
jgi:hypothetical protein